MTRCTDVYGYLWPVACELVPDPCFNGQTVFHLAGCTADNPPLPEWCATVPTHLICVKAGLPAMPTTGSTVVLPITASGLLLAGLLCLLPRRFRCR